MRVKMKNRQTLPPGVPYDTPILTPHGWQNVSDVSVGAAVTSGNDGSPVKVVAVTDRATVPCYAVHLADGSKTTASAGQPFEVWRPNGRSRTVVDVETMARDCIHISPGGAVSRRYAIEGVDVTTPPAAPLPLHPYVVGALLTAGSLGGTCNHTGTPSPFSLHVANHAALETLLPLLPPNVSFDQYRSGPCKYFANTATLKQLFEDAHIFGLSSAGRHIPQKYLDHGGIDLLRGLLDFNGPMIRNATPSFINASATLVRDVQTLVRRLGGRALQSVQDAGSGFDTLRIRTNQTPYAATNNAALWTQIKSSRSCHRAVCDVSLIGDMPVRALEVEGGVFMTGDYIKTGAAES